ncbi:3-deoxy-manno-octulosonate cytidylyltransferase [Aestuariibacter sp. A3R04]|uniref:3-deoxy-manno-octulosonate cytidylyltransferase n=1 Tax=Aestuariibacter sp. A3R04 TaxID=2841571 RepID=UPI001C09C498|nr:3-deoxy-manno-octulosonate cytidylyltransferase [Aestuariibacter sp. A3R04]MBU3022993.1 3-deoxy-manno-octulosonate cytidylyltransferase [Aestuariibacter sp. A3R04]
MRFTVIIPARYGSSRFPGKPLADIQGKPMIQHTVERAMEAGADNIIVATDDDRIARVATAFSRVVMTSDKHESGTERLSEVIQRCELSDDTLVVNVQGDEPFVPANNIRQVAQNLAAREDVAIATLATPVTSSDDVLNPNIVKVVRNARKEALYFSRSPVPFERATMMKNPEHADPSLFLRHIGLYAYNAGYVTQYVAYAPTVLERTESLEQLRALWYGDKIHVDIASSPPPAGVDTPDDLARLIASMHVNV